MNRLTKTAYALAAVALILSLAIAIPMGAAAKSSAALDARLGGTNKSFQASFGAPDASKSNNGIEVYSVSGFGLVAAAFLNSNANEITIAANRLAHTPLTDADPADWTVTNATKFVEPLVPTDATYGKPDKNSKRIELAGHSKTLEGVFTKANYVKLQVGGVPGDFTVVYNLDASGNVFSADVSVGAGMVSVTPTATAKSGHSTSSTGSSASATKAATTSASSGSGAAAVHCKDFSTQAEAQSYFDSHGGDSNPAVSGMDGDKDGKACETLP